MTNAANDLDALLGVDWRHQAECRRSEIVRRIGGRTKVLLFGAGYLGTHVRGDLKDLPFEVAAFVDNDPSLWGRMISELEVLSPDAAMARFGERALWLITVYTNATVIDQCRSLGVPWVTCAELSWVLPEPKAPSLDFGTPDVFSESAAQVEAAASLWADAASEAEYRSQVRWRFLLDYAALRAPRPTVETYFPVDVFRASPDEVFVDCGAFTGDTIEAFIGARGGRFESIVAIEPDAVNCRELRARIDDWGRSGIGPIRVEPVAAGSRRGRLRFETTGTAGSSVGSGVDTVEVVPLDEILAGDEATYIKFDVEGAEHDALLGASATIRAWMPVLAVCLYHKPADLWDLPLLIRSLGPEYRMYLRRYSDERWESVCYAVPPDRVLS